MARFQAIAATSATLRHLVQESLKGTLTESQVQVFQAADFGDPKATLGSDDGLSLYLYRVSLNAGQRNLHQRVNPDGTRNRPPMVIDLHYLVSAWSKDALTQQTLLARAMLCLGDRPSLPAGSLNGVINADVFRRDETVELVAETLGLQDLAVVWEVAKANPQPSAAYVARMVALESDAESPAAGAVQTREFEIVVRRS